MTETSSSSPTSLTGGGPNDGTFSVIQRIWDTGFSLDKMDMAAAMSFLFGIVLVGLNLVSFRFFSSERA